MGGDFHHDGERLQAALWNRWKLSRNAQRPSWRLLHLGKDLFYMSDDISLMVRVVDFFIFWFFCRLFMATFAYQLSTESPVSMAPGDSWWQVEGEKRCQRALVETVELSSLSKLIQNQWIGLVKSCKTTGNHRFLPLNMGVSGVSGSNFPVDQSNDKSAWFDGFPFGDFLEVGTVVSHARLSDRCLMWRLTALHWPRKTLRTAVDVNIWRFRWMGISMDIPKWMVCNGKSCWNEWFITTILRNLHMALSENGVSQNPLVDSHFSHKTKNIK